MKNLKLLSGLAFALLAAGCSSVTSAPQQPQTQASDQQAQQQRTGRFAVLVYDSFAERNTDSVQGGFVWNDYGDRLDLELLTPVGSTLARIQAAPGRATLTDSSGKTIEAGNVDDLVRRALKGKPIPVSGMIYWVKGQLMSQPQASNVTKSADGHLQSFEQNGWKAELSDYDDQGPTSIRLQRKEDTKRISVRVKID